MLWNIMNDYLSVADCGLCQSPAMTLIALQYCSVIMNHSSCSEYFFKSIFWVFWVRGKGEDEIKRGSGVGWGGVSGGWPVYLGFSWTTRWGLWSWQIMYWMTIKTHTGVNNGIGFKLSCMIRKDPSSLFNKYKFWTALMLFKSGSLLQLLLTTNICTAGHSSFIPNSLREGSLVFPHHWFWHCQQNLIFALYYVIELDDALFRGNVYSKNVPVSEKYYICKSYKKFIC